MKIEKDINNQQAAKSNWQ